MSAAGSKDMKQIMERPLDLLFCKERTLFCPKNILALVQVEQLIHGKEDSQGNINYEEFVKMVLAQ